jgi:lysophospholipase L1-like esterase
VLLGLVLTLVLAEIGLRLASTLVGTRASEADPTRSRTILTLGDSHTYGVYFSAEESYPRRLEAQLAERAPGRYQVINLGLPGMNSSEIATRLPDWLEQYHPDIAIIGIGVNNIWNRSDTDLGGRVSRLVDSLRVVRVARLIGARTESSPGENHPTERPELDRILLQGESKGVEHRDAESGELLIRHTGGFAQRIPLAKSQAILNRDLTAILDTARQAATELVVLTYAEYPFEEPLTIDQRNHRATNRTLRAFARTNDLWLVDVALRFRALLSQGRPPSRYFHVDRFHLSPEGYAEVAPLVADLFEPRSSSARDRDERGVNATRRPAGQEQSPDA